MTIKKLDLNVVQKIAAGEVIESPVSVVKELVENAIDAQSTLIEIILFNGGKDMIAVKDNGIGMKKEDLLLSYQRHATSKIIDSDDLYNIATLGFRGEALASINSVSRMTITSKHKDNMISNTIFVSEEKLLDESTDTLAEGTIVIVKDLFYNLPVRRNFMKERNYELRKIIDLVKAYSLVNTKIHFKLINLDNNNKFIQTFKEKEFLKIDDIKYSTHDVLLDSPRTKTIQEKISSVFGYNIAKELLEIDNHQHENIFVNGVISKPTLYRQTKSNIFVYVNKRYVTNKIINLAIIDAYSSILSDKYPFALIDITVPKSFVDVNIHPSKLELKFVDDSLVYSSVYGAIDATLKNNSLIPSIVPKATSTIQDFAEIKKMPISNQKTFSYSQPKTIEQKTLSPSMESIPKSYGVDSTFYQSPDNNIRIIGQFANAYIIVQKDDKLLLLDQHVVEERINYEKLRDALASGSIKKQQLLKPLQLSINVEDSILIKDNIQLFDSYGIDIELLDNTTAVIRSLPYVLKDQLDKDVVYDIIEQLKENKALNSIDAFKDNIIKQMACKASVKQGKNLTMEYMQKMVDTLFKSENPYVCPHGRPVIVEYSLDELNKMFKR